MDTTYLSREELEAPIRGLSDADFLKLKRIAQIYIGNHDMDADDLLQEAIVRTLSGERRTCPRNVPVITFITGIMRSIASGEREKYPRMERLNEDEWNAIESLESSPEKNLIDLQAFAELETIFEDDNEILQLILHLRNGDSAVEIKRLEGWSETQYSTIRRRMRRNWNAT